MQHVAICKLIFGNCKPCTPCTHSGHYTLYLWKLSDWPQMKAHKDKLNECICKETTTVCRLYRLASQNNQLIVNIRLENQLKNHIFNQSLIMNKNIMNKVLWTKILWTTSYYFVPMWSIATDLISKLKWVVHHISEKFERTLLAIIGSSFHLPKMSWFCSL